MIDTNDASFINDLAKLIRKHGTAPLARLTAILQNPEQVHQLNEVLSAALKLERQTRPQRRSRVSLIGETILRELRTSDIDMHNVILLFRDEFITGLILPTMQDVRDFARMNDLSIGRATSRNTSLVPLIRSLSELSVEDVRYLHRELNRSDASSDSSRTLGHLRDAIIGSTRVQMDDESMQSR